VIIDLAKEKALTGNRVSVSLAVATAMAGVGATLAMPVAHADPLDGIRAAVNNVRAGATCGALTYSGQLEAAAQGYARNQSDQNLHGYPGTARLVSLKEDPTAEATEYLVIENENSIKNCKYKDFGVGMTRVDDDENSVVAIALGEPAQQAPPPPEQAAPPQADNRSTMCTETGTIVPAGEKCPARAQAEKPPTDAVRMVIARGVTDVTVQVSSTANIAGQCTFNAEEVNGLGLPVTRTLNIAPRGTAELKLPAPVFGQTYHAVLSCRGDFNGQNVEFGRAEQDV
jgi:hypothetical protein